ncbi:hypothetical protein D3OALGA1CA_5751 [Olavius algarvensis associated proteobacterium Delta 3]|nr:hypothetical protein D3OALGB2SA_2422 [Olavius algarvensis associated proteobacterium Delta 3]CAB5171261.1 hypothetical protein D3OALGA1CA_5751 [Olavius algarvensis associated proteobacterium Delta 3]
MSPIRVSIAVFGLFFFLTSLNAGAALIMPLGDSITVGGGSWNSGGYRAHLAFLLQSGGHPFDFVGSQNSGILTDDDHEGHWGWHADAIRDNVEGWLDQNPADIILLHIGTNDILAGQQPAFIIAEIDGILDNIYLFTPQAQVVLAQIINRRTYSPEVTEFNILLAELAMNRQQSGDSLYLVDMESALDYTTDMATDAHPNPYGYEKMADVWYAQLETLVPAPVPASSNLLMLGLVCMAGIRLRLKRGEL